MPRCVRSPTGRAEAFESVADGYHQARPDYPPALLDARVDLAGLRPRKSTVEGRMWHGQGDGSVGAEGVAITTVELGAKLAAVARRNLADFERVTVHQGSFERWPPVGGQPPFDLVFAATAWHWVAPEIGYRRARELLRPGGHLSFWSATHVLPGGGDSFFTDLQDAYEEIGEALPDDAVWYRPGELPDDGDSIRDSGLFDELQVRQFDWEIVP
jgi:SAM-dependent methyltransferase